MTLDGFFFEPRRVVDVGSSKFAPYASARLAFLCQSVGLSVQGTDKFGDVEVDIDGIGSTKIDGSSGNGSNMVLRAGLAIGLR